jgi:hypothetical protein
MILQMKNEGVISSIWKCGKQNFQQCVLHAMNCSLNNVTMLGDQMRQILSSANPSESQLSTL